jgi:tocopherol O-methyltransferase
MKTDIPLFSDRKKMTRKIADFWNKTTEGWRTVWGPHIHHGYYENNIVLTPLKAQEKLIEKLIELLDLTKDMHILDVGCGMGGSSIYLAKNYHVNVTGISLSKKQIDIALQEAQECHLENVIFKIEDALALDSFEANSFNIVWSLESCEQFYDKELFIKQAFRVLKPGGQLILATWCSDRDEYQDQEAKKYYKLCKVFDLPYMPTLTHYCMLLEKQNFAIRECLDWSTHVKNSWEIGISIINTYSLFKGLKLVGWRGVRFAKQIKLMQEAFHQGRVKYGVFVATK